MLSVPVPIRMSSRIIRADRVRAVAPFRLDPLGGTSARHRPAGPAPDAEPAPSVESVRADAFEEGRRQGRQEALAEAARLRLEDEQAESARFAQRIGAIVADFETSLDTLQESLADRIFDLAVRIAAQTVRTHVDTRPDAVLPALREAVSGLLTEAGQLVVHVSPADENVAREALAELSADRRFELRVDAALHPGGCVVDSPTALVDATIESRWQKILAALGRPEASWPASESGSDRHG